MQAVNLRSFKRKLAHHRNSFRRFLNKTEKKPPRYIAKLLKEIEPKVWAEIDCLTCANCCKKMTPTFTEKDVKRIAAHLQMEEKDFIKRWLKKSDGDWVNKNQPCQFLDLKTNMCSIYEVRPVDCAGFPHLGKTKWALYAHMHKQNIDYCPATYSMIEKLMDRVEAT